MKKRFLLVFTFFCFLHASFGADIFDLRVLPDFDKGQVLVEGTVATNDTREEGISRRSKIFGMLGSWVGSETVKIEHGQKQFTTALVKEGEFSVFLPVSDMASFSLKVFSNEQLLRNESFNFPANVDFIVVSDIDDTILVTQVTSTRRLVYNSLFKKLEERQPVKGASEFYQNIANQKLIYGKPHFIYLSSSPSYFSRLLKAFVAKNKFPQGSLVLKKSLLSGEHTEHKGVWLKKIATRYSDKPLVLIGDSGEQDPEIYSEFALSSEFGKRIKLIIIHEVTQDSERIAELEKIRQNLEKQGIALFYWNDIDLLKKALTEKKILAP